MEEGLGQLLGVAEPPPPEPVDPGESPEPSPSPEPGGSQPPLPTDVAELVSEISRVYEEAQRALAAGDLGTYQERIDELEALIDALEAETGQ